MGTPSEPYRYRFVTTNEEYEHTKLNSDSIIRVLILHTKRTEFDDDVFEEPLTATFVEEDISQVRYRVVCPVPDIVSPPGPIPKTIDTPEGSITITPALHAALVALRRMSTADLYLWVADLCIDWRSPEEKRSRIRLIQPIYTHAQEVIAYLGEDEPDAGNAHDLLFRIARLPVNSISLLPSSRTSLSADDVQAWFERTGLPRPRSPDWKAFDRFLCRPWFRSLDGLPACVWAKTLRLAGSGWSLPADDFVAAAVNIWIAPFPLFGMGGYSEEMERGARCFSFFSRMRVISQNTPGKCGFVELLRQCRSAEARSPEQRLEILLSVSSHRDKLADVISGEMDESERMLQAFRFLYSNTTEGLQLLSEARGCTDADTTNQPSWTPSLSSTANKVRLASNLDFRTAVPNESPPISTFALDTLGRLTVFCAPLPCACAGHNRIAATSNYPPETRSDDLDGIPFLLAHWWNAQSMLGAVTNAETGLPFTHYSDSTQPILDALWDIFRMGKDSATSLTEQQARSVASAKAVFVTLLDKNMRGAAESHFEVAKPVMMDMAEKMEGWRFAVTNTGYMGLVPLEAREGDVVMAVWEARVPFVLRPVGRGEESAPTTHEYQVVGECYLHGVMAGEKIRREFRGKRVVLV